MNIHGRSGGARGRSASVARWAALVALALTAGACGGSSGGGGGSDRHRVSGTISGAVAPGVTVTISGTSGTTSTTTGTDGAFAFDGLASGAYTVTPSLSGYTFSPASRAVTLSGADLGGQDFTSAAVATGRSISGTISGAITAGVTLTLTNAATSAQRTATTGASGTYAFPGLEDGVYVVAASRDGYAFAPASLVVTVSGANQAGIDFAGEVASGATHVIQGTLSGATRAGVLITMTSSPSALRRSPALRASLAAGASTTVTDASGNFRFAGMLDGSYTLTPSKPGFDFQPASLSASVAGGDVKGLAFAAAAAPETYAISGTVSGAVKAGVIVALTQGDTLVAHATTDESGAYRFEGLANGSYTVTPHKAGYTFSPASASVSVSGADVSGTRFAADADAVTHSLSGVVSGAVKAGVTITVTGASITASATTDEQGAFTVSGLADGSYAVTPSGAGYAFDPVSLTADVHGQDVALPAPFLARAATAGHTISGKISGGASAGVEVRLTGDATGTTTTDSAGGYAFAGMADGSYVVTPLQAGYTFAPESASVKVAGADVSGKDFVATAAGGGYTLSGTVTGPWVEGIAVTLGGTSQATTTTDAHGAYRFEGLAPGDYLVTPSLAGYDYAPEQHSVTITTSDVVRDFQASSTVPGLAISGTVSYAGVLGGRVRIQAYAFDSLNDGGVSAETVIEASGPFTVPFTLRGLPPAKYVVSAFLDAYDLGLPNAIVPQDTLASTGQNEVILVDADLNGFAIDLQDMPEQAPQAPANFFAFGGDSSALLRFDGPRDSTTSYRIAWGTDADASSGGVVDVGARHDLRLIDGLENGKSYYFKIAGVSGTRVGDYSSPFGPVEIGAPAGEFTISGVVSLPTAARGPLYVFFYDPRAYPPRAYFQRIAGPATQQAYRLSLPPGSYYTTAAVDMDRDGVIAAGDLVSEQGSGDELTITADTALDFTLTDEGAVATALTQAWSYGSSELVGLQLLVNDVAKEVVNVTLVSGRGLPVPCDLGQFASKGRSLDAKRLGAVPGDVYRFRVQYSDGSVETLEATVGGILGYAQDLAVVTAAPQSATVPLFTWAAPASPPASFSYELEVTGSQQAQPAPSQDAAIWWYALDRTQHQVAYNADGRAMLQELVPAYGLEHFHWSVTVRDARGNTSTRVVDY